MSLLRMALEGSSDKEIISNSVEETDDLETEITETNIGIENYYTETEKNYAVMESLSLYRCEISNLLTNNVATQTTIDLINLATKQELKRISSDVKVVSLECRNESIVQQHIVAMEGIRDTLFNMFQVWVIRRKHFINAVSDFFRSTDGKINKYTNKLDQTNDEYNSKKSTFNNGPHKGSLDQLWYFFATDTGQTRNVVNALSKDITISKYILVTYPNEILSMISKLTGIVKSTKISKISDIEKLVKNIEALKHPADVFNGNYTKGRQLLGVIGLGYDAGSRRSAVTIGNNTFDKLAVLASPRVVTETFSKRRTAMKVATQVSVTASYIDFVLSANIEYSTADIGKVINYGFEYIDNIRKYLSLSDKITNTNELLTKATLLLSESVSSDFSSNELASIQSVCVQIEQYSMNLLHAIQSPATQEVARSLKGSKYCMYLANRMLFNAT